MSLRDLAIDRLLAVDPRQSALHTLDLLRAHTQADRAGLFLLRGDVVELFAGHGIDQASLDWLRTQWERQKEWLGSGRPVIDGPRCAWPLQGALVSAQVAAVYLGGAPDLTESSARNAVEAVGDILGRCLSMAEETRQFSPAIDRYLKTASTESVLRRQLEGLLHENEWNISRVARVLGVTRVTVYARMQRLGIERLHVPKVP